MARRVWEPRIYQPPAVNHIIEHPRCALFAGMGTGKGSSTLTALDIMFLAGEETQPAIVFAPLRVAREVWTDEAAKWEHLRDISVSPIVGSEKERRAAMKRDAAIYTCNFENIPWLMNELGGKWPYGTVICDESSKLKGFRLRQGAARPRALAPIAHKKARRWINLTGTPASNGLADLWGQTWFLDAGERLGRSFDAFRQRWFQQSFDGYSITPLPFAQEEIQGRLRDICLSIDIRDYYDIKEPQVIPVYVELPAKARRMYDEMERKMYTQIAGHEVEAFSAAAKSLKCLQLASGAVYVDVEDDITDTRPWVEVHDAKLQALESIIEEAGGRPVLVGYYFKSDLVRLMKAFPKGRRFDDDPQTKRDFIAGKIPQLFIHPKSAAHGVDGLQDATNILALFSQDWNLEEYQQLLERIGPTRQFQSGRDSLMYVYPIVARDTVDELVMARRESKREVQDLLLESMKRKGIR